MYVKNVRNYYSIKKNPYVYQTTLLLVPTHPFIIKIKSFDSLKFSHL